MLFSSIKAINRLSSKGMSNIYLKLTIEKVRLRSVSGELQLTQISLNFNHWNQRPGSKAVCGFSIVFTLKGFFFDVLKAKIPRFLLNENKNFTKNVTELKMENLTLSFREISHVLQHIVNVYFLRKEFF